MPFVFIASVCCLSPGHTVVCLPRLSARGLNEAGMLLAASCGDGDLPASLKPLHGIMGGGESFITDPCWQGSDLQLGVWFQRKLSIYKTSKPKYL